MKTVSRSELTGYRAVTEREKQILIPAALKKIKYEKKFICGWQIFTGVVGLGMCGSFLIPGRIQTASVGTRIVELVLTFLIVGAFVLLTKGCAANKKLQKAVAAGQFAALDCRIWDVKFDTEMPGNANVKIYTVRGEYCSDWFSTSQDKAKEWKEGRNPSFLLMRCTYGNKKDFYLLQQK